MMKAANINIDREFFHIFWTTWENSVKSSGEMCFKIILKVTKKQGFTLSLEDTFFGKPQERGQIDPASRFRVKSSFIFPVSTYYTSFIQNAFSEKYYI